MVASRLSKSIVRRGWCIHSPTAAMISTSPWLLLAALAGLLIGLEACGDPPPVPTSITVTPEAATLDAVGGTVSFAATVRDQDGQTMSGVTVTWTSTQILRRAMEAHRPRP